MQAVKALLFPHLPARIGQNAIPEIRFTPLGERPAHRMAGSGISAQVNTDGPQASSLSAHQPGPTMEIPFHVRDDCACP